jgi:undecaprenyl-diphosphatase
MTASLFFEATPGSLPARLAERSPTHRPLVAGAAVAVAGYLLLTSVLLGLGLLITRTALNDSVGRWDLGIERWVLAQRTPLLDDVSAWGSRLGDTMTIIVLAGVVVLLLAIARHLVQAAFLVAALLIEVTTFLTTSSLVDRSRPPIPQLDVAPPTSSYPSGHTAAAIVLYVGVALIASSIMRSGVIRALAWTVAVAFPLAVGLSRLYRGMHHPTDLLGSVIGAAGCLMFALLATRTGIAVSDDRSETEREPSEGTVEGPAEAPDFEEVAR